VGAFPLANLVPYVGVLSDEGPILLVDLGAKTSDVLVCRNGEPVFSRTLDYGTEGLPQTASRVAREIRVTIAAYRSAGGSAPTRVLLSGSEWKAGLGAEAFLAGELELPVAAIPEPALEIENVAPELLAELPRFAKAIGLALGLTGRALSVDLRRGPLAYERGFAWIKEKVPMLAGLGAVIMVSFFFSAGAQLYASAKERSTLESALGIVTGEVLGESTTILAQQVGTVDEDPLPHADAFDVMVKLSEDIPMSMVHDIEELDVQKGHVVVHGIVGSIPDAQAIATSLRNEKCFQEVKITNTHQVVGGERQKYVLEFDLKCPEDVKTTAKKPGAPAAPAASGGGK
jgi:general secretion pathway protein L